MQPEKTTYISGLKVRVKKGVVLPRHKKRPSCLVLTTADRLTMLLGKPAKELYVEIVKIYEWWSKSPEWQFEYVYHSGYVYKAQCMWYDLSREVPGPGQAPPPTIYQKSVSPDAYIAERQKELDRIISELVNIRKESMRVRKYWDPRYGRWFFVREELGKFVKKWAKRIILLIQAGYVLIVYGRPEQIEEFRNLVDYFYEEILKPWEVFSLIYRERIEDI